MASAEAEDAATQSSLARTAKDLFAGAAGGIAQVLLGKQWQISRFIGSNTFRFNLLFSKSMQIGPL